MTQKLLSRDCSYRQTQKGKYQLIVMGNLSELAERVSFRQRLLLMMVSKMKLLTKGLHVLWRVCVFTKEVCIFCNGDNSGEALHEVTCTEVTMMIG